MSEKLTAEQLAAVEGFRKEMRENVIPQAIQNMADNAKAVAEVRNTPLNGASVDKRTIDLEQVLALTTPGPWSVGETDDNEGHPETVIRGMGGRAGVAVAIDFGKNNPLMREANAIFIAAARQLIPELLARIRELESARATEGETE